MEQKILLVEDDDFLRDIYTEVLSVNGMHITSVANADDALKLLQGGEWNLILIDFYLPGITGVQLLEKIKAITPPPVKKCIFLTNVSDEHDLAIMKASGDGYLIKSEFTPQQLVEKVKEFLV